MASLLTQSDVVAIVIGVLQIAATVAVGVWAVVQNKPKVAPPKTAQKDETRSERRRRIVRFLVKNNWPLPFALAMYGAYKLLTLYSEYEVVTAPYLFQIVIWISYFTFNLASAWMSWVVGGILEVVWGIMDIQERVIALQEDSISVMQSALTNRSTPTRRKRRAG